MLAEEEAESIAKMSASEKDPNKVSLKKVEEHMKNPGSGSSRAAVPSLTREKAQEILSTKVFTHLKRFLATHEVNLVDLFNDQEENDGYFNRQELTKAF